MRLRAISRILTVVILVGVTGAAFAQERCGTCAIVSPPTTAYLNQSTKFDFNLDIPTSCYQYSYRWAFVEWGDGTWNTVSTGPSSISHTYQTVGDKTILFHAYESQYWPASNPGLVCETVTSVIVPPCVSNNVMTTRVLGDGVTVIFDGTVEPDPNSCYSLAGTVPYTLDFGDSSTPGQGIAYKDNGYRVLIQHEYASTPKTYTWSLTARPFNSPDLTASTTITGTVTIGPVTPSETFGAITFTADQRTANADGSVTMAGTVKANGTLLFSGPIALSRTAGTQNGSLSTSGNLNVNLASGTETLLAGTGRTFAIDGTLGTLSPSPVPEFLDLRLADLKLVPADPRIAPQANRVLLSPALILGDPLYVPSMMLPLALAQITLALPPGGYPQILETNLLDGNLSPYHSIQSLTLAHSSSENKITGTATLTYPRLGTWELASNLAVQEGCVSSFEGAGTGQGSPVLVGNAIPEFRMANLAGSIDWFCDPRVYLGSFIQGDWTPEPSPPDFAKLVSVRASYEPPKAFRFRSGSLLWANNPDAVTLTDSCYLLPSKWGDEVRLALRGSESPAHFGTSTSGARLDGTWKGWVLVSLRNFLTFCGRLGGTLTLQPYTCASQDAECRSRKTKLKKALRIPPDQPLSRALPISDWAAFGESEWTPWYASIRGKSPTDDGPVEVSIRLTSQGMVVVPYSDLANLAAGGFRVPPGPAESERAYTLGPDRLPATFSASGEASVPSISLHTPGGQTITPATVGNFPGVTYIEDASEFTALFDVESPEPGTWVLSQNGLPAEQVAFAAMAEKLPPSVSVSLSPLGGGRYQVTATVSPPDSNTLVSLSGSRMSDGVPEETFAWDLPAGAGTVSATWDTAGLPSGTWYAFASVEYGTGVPLVVYATQPVPLDDGALLAPTNLQGSRSGSSATLSFTPSASPTATAHLIRSTSDPSVPGFDSAVPVSSPSRVEIPGLDPQKTYLFWAVATDDTGLSSPESAPLTLPPSTAPGDCDGDGTVSIGEVQKAINMFLGTLAVGCNVDANGNGTVSIGEVQLVVNAFLGVVPGVSVSVSPSISSVLPNGTQQFAATVTGTTNTAVTWSVQEGAAGGSVTGVGLYTAPSSPGTYHVKATSLADSSKSGSATVTVTQAPSCTLACTASASPGAGQAPLPVTFTSTATPSNCPGGVTFAWTFGDGATSTQQNPSHTYAAAGTFTWTLTASVSGVTCSKSGSVTVTAAPGCSITCTASATPASGTAPLGVDFAAAATATHCTGGTSYAWTFGDDSTSTQQNPPHIFLLPGSYPWTMTASAGGQSCSQSGTVTVTAPADGTPLTLGVPVAGSITGATQNASWNWYYLDVSQAQTIAVDIADLTGDVDLYVRFDERPDISTFYCRSWNNGTTAEHCDAPATGPTRIWIGVTNYSTGIAVQYSVTATAGGAEMCRIDSCDAVPNISGLTVAFFSTYEAAWCTESPTYFWSFGDGSTSLEPDPVHTYASPGTYNWTFGLGIGDQTCDTEGMVQVPGR